jgi:hypothetical protein
MKRLKLSATITAVLGFFSAIALIFLYIAFADMAGKEIMSPVELYIGICLIVLTIFTISVFVTLTYLLKTSSRLINLTTDTGISK